MRTALFTGAGASCAIGYPLTRELLPLMLDGLNSASLFEGTNGRRKDRQNRNELFDHLVKLLPGLKSVTNTQELPLITDVFSLLEYAIVSDEALPNGGAYSLRRCRDLLKQAIIEVLRDSAERAGDSPGRNPKNSQKVLAQVADWVDAQGDTLGLVTTNYDIGLESEMYRRLGRVQIESVLDLGFDWRDVNSGRVCTRPANPKFRVYKLHGSLDVLRCPLCGHVYFNPYGAIARQAFREQLDDGNACHCRRSSRLDLHIVSPSLVREVRDANLLSVWRSALEWMRNAERWIIVGYSLPSEDLAVRSMLLRAYVAANTRPDIIVVQHGNAARAQYELLFPGCRYVSGGLQEYLNSEQAAAPRARSKIAAADKGRVRAKRKGRVRVKRRVRSAKPGTTRHREK
jgi:NAD-dependent SIR2 family protein deacetylase